MSVSRLSTIPLALALAATVVFAPAAARDRKPPRIVAAAMVDANGNFRADRVRLVYSERVRHAADRDGHYPFAVAGYRIRSVGSGSGRTLVVVLAEKGAPDGNARPTIRYRRTKSRPVGDLAGNQEAAQVFRRVRPFGHVPPAAPAPPPAPAQAPPPAPAPAPQDADHDGTVDSQDCAPKDSSIHPGAPDLPDLSFVDSNCDGIDGTEKDAIFVSPSGNDANPGTKARPKRTIQAAVATVAAGNGKYVLVAAGQYDRVEVDKDASGIGIYGGYDPKTWSRGTDHVALVVGTPEGVLLVHTTGVVLQLLAVGGVANTAFGSSKYGIRATDGSKLTLQRVHVSVSNAMPGLDAGAGAPGSNGGRGLDGLPGACDDDSLTSLGGHGGFSPAGRRGGEGGTGGVSYVGVGSGFEGSSGQIGTPGGAGGKLGDPGGPGSSGQAGSSGAPGLAGAGGSATTVSAGATWVGQPGGIGSPGQPGNGGGGGGGGGGQDTFLNIDTGTGNGGGGGGGGAAGGAPGAGGGPGGGSFGIYLFDSSVDVQSSTIQTGPGGRGGNGGPGGAGATGGAGGKGAATCTSEVGRGGDGGRGGNGGIGGHGGGGAGGPSIGIFKTGTSTARVHDSKITHGSAGDGGGGDPSVSGSKGQPGIAADVYPS